MSVEITVTALNLSKADELDIRDVDRERKVVFEKSKRDGDKFNEPATLIAVFALSALYVLALWIVKNRTGSKVELEIEVKNPDGSSRRVVYRKAVTKETSDAEVLKELQHLAKLPV